MDREKEGGGGVSRWGGGGGICKGKRGKRGLWIEGRRKRVNKGKRERREKYR